MSPTRGPLTFEEMFADITGYMHEAPNADYRVIIGTDSHTRDETNFVTAVIIHRTGKGARYYYQKRRHRHVSSLRQKIHLETFRSLEVGYRLMERFSKNGLSKLNVEIHLDVGANGDTKDIIREVVGIVTGSGFDAKVKPDSYGASKVADKHSK